jgi:hypothetical protein
VIELTAELAKRLLDYNPISGELFWKARTPDLFKNKRVAEGHCEWWNSKYSGKIAYSLVDNNKNYKRSRITLLGKTYFSHRVIWLIQTGKWPDNEIDHIDMNSNNNKWNNLREASRSQNAANRKISPINTSGFKGVYLNKSKNYWYAQIRISGKLTHLGIFPSKEEAAKAYTDMAEKVFGEYARW